jgi:hypothetical protein
LKEIAPEKGFTDGLLCIATTATTLHEVHFELHDIEKAFSPHFSTPYNSKIEVSRKLWHKSMESDPRFIDKDKDYAPTTLISNGLKKLFELFQLY